MLDALSMIASPYDCKASKRRVVFAVIGYLLTALIGVALFFPMARSGEPPPILCIAFGPSVGFYGLGAVTLAVVFHLPVFATFLGAVVRQSWPLSVITLLLWGAAGLVSYVFVMTNYA